MTLTVETLAALLRQMGRDVAYKDGKIATHVLVDECADQFAAWLLPQLGAGAPREAYVMAMAILQSPLYASADDELRAAVDHYVGEPSQP